MVPTLIFYYNQIRFLVICIIVYYNVQHYYTLPQHFLKCLHPFNQLTIHVQMQHTIECVNLYWNYNNISYNYSHIFTSIYTDSIGKSNAQCARARVCVFVSKYVGINSLPITFDFKYVRHCPDIKLTLGLNNYLSCHHNIW